MCNYQGYEFGGGYLDSVCIDGELWDADSGNGDMLTYGGNIPCSACNRSEWMAYYRSGIIDIGFEQGFEGVRPKVLMYGGYPSVVRADSAAMKKAQRWIMRGWYRGKKEKSREDAQHG
ncbi:hypothetical protein [Serratia fonticola]